MEFYNIKTIYRNDVMKTLGKQFIDELSKKINDINVYKNLIKDIVYCTPCMIEFIEQTPELCKTAVSIHNDVVKYVKDISVKNQLIKQYCLTEKITKK
jgi:uncharacterized coiled-coil DUF342 family protein